MAAYTKNLSDNISANDIITWDTMTSSWDTYTVTWDALNSIGVKKQTVKNPTETTSYGENKSSSFARNVQEGLFGSDSLAKTVSRALLETIVGAETFSKQPGKQAIETSVLSESIGKSIVLYRVDTEVTSEKVTSYLNGLELIWTKIVSVSTIWDSIIKPSSATYTNVGNVTTIWDPIAKSRSAGYGTWDQMTITWDAATQSWDYDGFDKVSKPTTTYSNIPRAGTN